MTKHFKLTKFRFSLGILPAIMLFILLPFFQNCSSGGGGSPGSGNGTTSELWQIASNSTDGLNASPNQDAGAANLIFFENRLYATWTEANGSGVYRVTVSVLTNLDDPNDWNILSTSVNKDSKYNAANPKFTIVDDKLYLTWTERDPLDVLQVRAARFGGFGAPTWTLIDGNGTVGQNKSSSFNAYALTPTSFTNKLYVAWSESNASGQQIQVKVYDPATSAWTFVTGHFNNGINLDPGATLAGYPELVVASHKLYAFWIEKDSSSMHNKLRAAVYNGDDSNPSWNFIDGGGAAGLNYGVNGDASTMSPKCLDYNQKIFCTYFEDDTSLDLTNNMFTFQRVISYSYSDPIPAFTFVDTGWMGLNVATQNYTPYNAGLGVYDSKLYALSIESDGSIGFLHAKYLNSAGTGWNVSRTNINPLNFTTQKGYLSVAGGPDGLFVAYLQRIGSINQVHVVRRR